MLCQFAIQLVMLGQFAFRLFNALPIASRLFNVVQIRFLYCLTLFQFAFRLRNALPIHLSIAFNALPIILFIILLEAFFLNDVVACS